MGRVKLDQEGEPYFTINITGLGRPIPKICTPENTGAFVHPINYKDVDHVWRAEDEEVIPDVDAETANVVGMYIFRMAFGGEFNDLVAEMDEHGYSIIEAEVPTDDDWDAFIRQNNKDIDKYWEVLDGIE